MFKIFLSLLISMVVVAVCRGDSLSSLVKEARQQRIQHAKTAAAQQTSSVKHSNLRAQTISGTVSGNYMMETFFPGGLGCVGMETFVQAHKTNECIGYDVSMSGSIIYVKYECYMDSKQAQLGYYDDADCTVPTSNSDYTAQQITNLDACQNYGSVMYSCHADSSFLNSVFKGTEMTVAFADATQMAANDLPNAKFFAGMSKTLKQIKGIKPEDRQACNRKIAYGECVDTTNAMSYARIARSFDSAVLNLYSKSNGIGAVARVPSPVAVGFYAGLHYTIRYPVAGWYDQFFGVGAGSSGASVTALEAVDEVEEK